MLGARGEDDEVGERAEEREPVGLVDEQLLGIGEHRRPARGGLPSRGARPASARRSAWACGDYNSHGGVMATGSPAPWALRG